MQELLVGIIVLLAALYLGARYLPATWRRWLVQRLTRGGMKRSRLAGWLDTSGSCGGCNTCETSAPQPPAGNKHRVIKLHERR
ncbi:DUF6587 family protein [Massilia sp. ZL223]|uniref:DUF6587 family protein n=1 Tax=Massilia sp. ZL223 TaxID=2824904 RepID=UPI001E48CB60|nr:DUF6587 family protein [Massilia sp. ZL223]